MKIFLDDFTVYSDMENDLMKCAFMVFLRLILRFIVSKEGKIPDPKKVQAIVNMLVLTNPQQIHVFNGMA